MRNNEKTSQERAGQNGAGAKLHDASCSRVEYGFASVAQGQDAVLDEDDKHDAASISPLHKAPAATNEHVRKSMQGNKRANTKPELTVRKILRDRGYTGYRLQWKKCPGRPDVAFPGRKIAIQVQGCFWHRCPKCQLSKPKSHAEYWEAKFAANQARDVRNLEAAREEGWKVITIWECDLKKKKLPQTSAYLYHMMRLMDDGPALDAGMQRIAKQRKARLRAKR